MTYINNHNNKINNNKNKNNYSNKSKNNNLNKNNNLIKNSNRINTTISTTVIQISLTIVMTTLKQLIPNNNH